MISGGGCIVDIYPKKSQTLHYEKTSLRFAIFCSESILQTTNCFVLFKSFEELWPRICLKPDLVLILFLYSETPAACSRWNSFLVVLFRNNVVLFRNNIRQLENNQRFSILPKLQKATRQEAPSAISQQNLSKRWHFHGRNSFSSPTSHFF